MARFSSLTAALMLLAAAATGAFGDERSEIGKKLDELRARFAADPRVKEAKAAIEAAAKAIDEKISSDPAIAEARRAEQAAGEAVAKASQAAAEDDQLVQEHRRELETARKRASELDLQRRLEEIRAEHVRNEARTKPDLRELWSRAQFHPHNQDVLKADPRLAAARKKLEEANAALDKRVRELDEFTAGEQARKEFEEAVRASQGMKDAEAARRTIEERIAVDDQVAAQVGKVKAAGEAQGAHRKEIEEIEKKIRDASSAAAAKDPRVAEAVKAMASARERVGKTIEERVATERKAREAAMVAWREKYEAVIAENAEARALMNEMRSLEERLQQLRTQMGELRRPVSP